LPGTFWNDRRPLWGTNDLGIRQFIEPSFIRADRAQRVKKLVLANADPALPRTLELFE